ncbi:MAG: MmcQ/YjbR family DNA-binding protein [Myxococcota bacterium]
MAETDSAAALAKLRALIETWPETSEKLSHGMPMWWGGRKTFACFHDGSYDEGRFAVWIKAPDGAQEALVAADPVRFYRPKYLGPSGWVALRLQGTVDWDEVRHLLLQGYRMVAPKRAISQLDAES